MLESTNAGCIQNVHNSGKEERKLRQRKMEREEKRRDREIM
jgi:hypothetical protein